MTLFTATILFILGATIGSFLSVVIHRMDKKKQKIILDRSICPSCKKKLKWRHLVPVFSWLFLRGKCAYCGKKISAHYLALEITTALTFLITFLKFNFIESFPSTTHPEILNYAVNYTTLELFIFHIIIFSFLIGIFFFDLMKKIIPDRLSLPAIVLTIAGNLLLNTGITPLDMLYGGAFVLGFFLLQFIVSQGKWIGGGDLRLGLLMGILLGLKGGILALIIAYVTGSIFSIYLLATKKVNRKTAIPFGPFLIIGTFTAFFFGNEIMNWYFAKFMF